MAGMDLPDFGGSNIATEEIVNEHSAASEQTRAFIGERIAGHRRLHQYRHELSEMQRPTAEERAIRARLRDRMTKKLRSRREVERLHELAEQRRRMLHNSALSNLEFQLDTGQLHPLDNPPTATGSSADQLMWWAYTTYFYSPQEASMWAAQDGDHIAAAFETTSGDLQKHQIRVLAHYTMERDRLPEDGKVYLSAPVAEIFGKAEGYATETGILDFGDQWAKLWLTTRQSICVLSAPKPPLSLVEVREAKAAAETRTLIFIENGGFDSTYMPGQIGMPPVRFSLPPDSGAVVAELEWSFDVQLENQSLIRIGHSSEASSCQLNHAQWPLTAV